MLLRQLLYINFVKPRRQRTEKIHKPFCRQLDDHYWTFELTDKEMIMKHINRIRENGLKHSLINHSNFNYLG